MHRRQALLSIAALATFSSRGAHAQSTRYRIGYLNGGTPQFQTEVLQAMFDGLKDSGLVRGRDFALEERWGRGDYDRLPAFAEELVALKPDLIIAIGSPAALAAARATQTIPVVFINVSNPVDLDIVKSQQPPGRNVTGISNVGDQTLPKQLELGMTLLPKATRIGLLVQRDDVSVRQHLRTFDAASKTRSVRYTVYQVEHQFDLKHAFEEIRRARTELLIVTAQVLFFNAAKELGALSTATGIPAVCAFRVDTDSGCLASYGINTPSSHRKAGTYIAKILAGSSPADMPVEQSTQAEMVINLKVAKALGITVPNELRLRADALIE